ncbi:hypothetical protein V2I01_22070 [Micromonospora sp. BRA006-A]|nr:hypothetical protein [Micromonospora sp. BRA006-A]
MSCPNCTREAPIPTTSPRRTRTRDLDGTDEDSPAEFGLPIDGTAPAEEDPTQR